MASHWHLCVRVCVCVHDGLLLLPFKRKPIGKRLGKLAPGKTLCRPPQHPHLFKEQTPTHIIFVSGEKNGEQLNVNDLSKKTCMKVDDIQATLQKASVIGTTKRNTASIVIPESVKEAHRIRMAKITTHIDPDRLHWTPVTKYI